MIKVQKPNAKEAPRIEPIKGSDIHKLKIAYWSLQWKLEKVLIPVNDVLVRTPHTLSLFYKMKDIQDKLTLSNDLIFYLENSATIISRDLCIDILKKEEEWNLSVKKNNQHNNSKREKQEQIGIKDKVFVKDREKCWFVKLKEVRFFESYGNYCRIYFKKEKPLVNKSLNYLRRRLDSKDYFRANRQYIINLNHIMDVCSWNHDSYRVTMSCGKKINFSRRKSQDFNERLSF